MKRTAKWSVCIIIGIIVLFTIFGFLMNSFNIRTVNLDTVNAGEYVKFDDMSVIVNKVDFINEDGKKFIVVELNAKKTDESSSNLNNIFGLSIKISNNIINESISYSKINGKKYYDSETGGSLLPKQEFEINPNTKIEFYYQCDDLDKEKFSQLENIGIIYPEKLYLNELKSKSNKLNTFRILGQFKM